MDLIIGVQARKWNSEKLIVFQMVILQRTRGVTRARDIKKRIGKRLEAWEEGNFKMLVQTTEWDMKTYLSKMQGTTLNEQQRKTFHQKMLRGNVRGAVKYLTEREKGGVLLPDDTDEKTGRPVKEVL